VSLEREVEKFGLGERAVTETIALPDDPDRVLSVVGNLEEVVASEHSRRSCFMDVRVGCHESAPLGHGWLPG
jgi:hypothetical protein